MQTETIISVLDKIAERINKEKDFLTELDNEIGDGDHGINMNRGFEALKPKLTSVFDKQPSEVFKLVGMTLVSTVGGASGPLYGTMFLNMSKALVGKDEINMPDFLEAVKSGIDGVSMRGKSTEGEKTMLDSMYPAIRAMNEKSADAKSNAEIIEAGVKAAQKGIEYTKTIVATKGRASYVGERSIGHQDPGATSFTMMLEELAKEIK